MRVGAVLIWFFVFPSVVVADPVSLLCRGEATIYGHGEPNKTITIDNAGSVLDLENATFKAPMYGTFLITQVDEAMIIFERQTERYSTLGNLDRISGNLTMTVMPPTEHKKMNSGESGYATAHVEAKCIPAKKMF